MEENTRRLVTVISSEEFDEFRSSIEKKIAEIESELDLYRSILPGLEYLTTQQAMNFLGVKRTKLWSLTKTKEIDATYIGSSVRYRTSSLKKYLQERSVDNQDINKKLKNIFQKNLQNYNT